MLPDWDTDGIRNGDLLLGAEDSGKGESLLIFLDPHWIQLQCIFLEYPLIDLTLTQNMAFCTTPSIAIDNVFSALATRSHDFTVSSGMLPWSPAGPIRTQDLSRI